MSIYNETSLFDGDKCIGGSYGWTTLVSDGEQEVPEPGSHSARAIANARLWDAAPELLHAAQRAWEHSPRCLRDEVGASKVDDCYCVACSLKSAIAKATGVQP